MSKNGAVDPLPPIRFADILFANVTDPNGKNPKTRRVVVLTPDLALKARYPIVVAGVTGTLPDPLTADYVLLPFKNSPGRHPKTGMTKKAAVLCTWIIIITESDVQGRSRFVHPSYMVIVSSKTETTAKAVGGWPWSIMIMLRESVLPMGGTPFTAAIVGQADRRPQLGLR